MQPSTLASPASHLRTTSVHPQTLSVSSVNISNSSSAGALSALTAELVECSQVDEILEVVSEEVGLLTGEAAVLALRRLAQCPRVQRMQLRASACPARSAGSNPCSQGDLSFCLHASLTGKSSVGHKTFKLTACVNLPQNVLYAVLLAI